MKKKIEYLQKIKNKGQKNVDEKIEKAQAQIKEMNEKASKVKIKRDQNQKKAYKIRITKIKSKISNNNHDNMYIYRTTNTTRKCTIHIFI